MAEPLVPDDLWEALAPLLPRHKAKPGKRGRPPVDDRACLTGIVFVLRSGIPWEMLPLEKGHDLKDKDQGKEHAHGGDDVKGKEIEANEGDRVRIVVHNILPKSTVLHLH